MYFRRSQRPDDVGIARIRRESLRCCSPDQPYDISVRQFESVLSMAAHPRSREVKTNGDNDPRRLSPGVKTLSERALTVVAARAESLSRVVDAASGGTAHAASDSEILVAVEWPRQDGLARTPARRCWISPRIQVAQLSSAATVVWPEWA